MPNHTLAERIRRRAGTQRPTQPDIFAQAQEAVAESPDPRAEVILPAPTGVGVLDPQQTAFDRFIAGRQGGGPIADPRGVQAPDGPPVGTPTVPLPEAVPGAPAPAQAAGEAPQAQRSLVTPLDVIQEGGADESRARVELLRLRRSRSTADIRRLADIENRAEQQTRTIENRRREETRLQTVREEAQAQREQEQAGRVELAEIQTAGAQDVATIQAGVKEGAAQTRAEQQATKAEAKADRDAIRDNRATQVQINRRTDSLEKEIRGIDRAVSAGGLDAAAGRRLTEELQDRIEEIKQATPAAGEAGAEEGGDTAGDAELLRQAESGELDGQPGTSLVEEQFAGAMQIVNALSGVPPDQLSSAEITLLERSKVFVSQQKAKFRTPRA